MAAWLLAAALAAGVLWLARDRMAERERLVRCAHEVRGPLTAAHLALHGAARRGELSPTRLAGLEVELRRAALALDDLRRRPHDPGAPFDLPQLVAVQVATWAEVARARGSSLTLAPPRRPTGHGVRGDAVRFAQALGNVLANAIEHGGDRIEVRLHDIGDTVRVEVHDDGPGLPAMVGELAHGVRRGARGRGLAIAAGALREHGGRLLAVPAPRGATVALELPAAAPSAGSAA